MKKSRAALVGFFALCVSISVISQSKQEAPTLSETLQWLTGASGRESSDGNTHISFESVGKNGCAVTITEIRAKADPGWYVKETFSLADVDSADIRVEKLKNHFKDSLLSASIQATIERRS